MKARPILTVLVMAMVMAFTSLSVAQGAPTHYSVTDLGTLGGIGSDAYSINSSGQVTGSSYAPGDSLKHVFLYSGGEMQDLGRPVLIS